MNENMTINAAILVPAAFYIVAMVLIGIYASKFSKTQASFILGGRSLGSWVTAFSYAFSGMSAWVLIGYVGLVYKTGPASFYILIGYNIGFTFAYFALARRVRNYSQLLGTLTYIEYFVRRVRDDTHLVRVFGGLATTIFMTAYVVSQFAASGKTVNVLFGISPMAAIVVSAVVVILYCLSGGFLAVSWTDFIQGLVVIFGIITLAIFIVPLGGGWQHITTEMAKIDRNMLVADMGKTGMAFFGAVLGYLFFAFNVIGRPHDTIRFFAMKSAAETRKSSLICVSSLTITYWAAFIIGYVGRILVPGLNDPELLFPIILGQHVHPILGGILLAVFLGLMMSTIDSQLLSASTTLVEDLYCKFVDTNASDEKRLFLSRVTIVLIGSLAALIAMSTPKSVFILTQLASGGLAASFGPVLILSVFWERLSKWGAIAGMLGGMCGGIIWMFGDFKWGTFPPATLPWAMSFVFAIGVSLMTKQPKLEEIASEIAACKNEWNFQTESGKSH